MGEPINTFGGGYRPQHLSRSEIEKMKKSMKKVPEIQLKSDIYHEHEITEADSILGNISPTVAVPIHSEPIEQRNTSNGPTSRIILLRQRFISLFS
ncbi:MAG: hypothetical protein NTX91_04110 [candidate division SR1 bacterium]|nr:hypothetical protein [candidate division SR1 bacterium]